MESKKLASLEGSGSGSQFIYTDDDGRFVVEWYDFGEGVPYESANMLIFGDSELADFARHLGMDPDAHAQQIATELSSRFRSYFAIRKYLDGAGLQYRHQVDFQP